LGTEEAEIQMRQRVGGRQYAVGSAKKSRQTVPAAPRHSHLLPTACRLPLTAYPAFTLVELLVVIAIISAVTIATIPLLLPALDSRRIREAARMVSTQFAEAQSEAIASGRSTGIWIERLSSEPTAAMDLFLCEVPPPYAGDSMSSTVTVKVDSTSGFACFTFNPGVDASALAADFLRPNDLIRFGYRGPYYRLVGATDAYGSSATNMVKPVQGVDFLDPQNNTRTSPPGYVVLPASLVDYDISTSPVKPKYRYLPPSASTPAGAPVGWLTTYQIFRQPVKSAMSPMQMPAGAVIDLAFSGVGGDTFQDELPTAALQGQFAIDKGPIIFTFDRSGALEYLNIMGQQARLTDPIHFLIGKREKLPPQAYVKTDPIETQSEKHNFRDLENIWISINPKTGLVTTAEVAQIDDTSITSGTPAKMLSQAVSAARQFATSAQSMGGR
jgi:type II secretory pathway pseudopilin PulG